MFINISKTYLYRYLDSLPWWASNVILMPWEYFWLRSTCSMHKKLTAHNWGIVQTKIYIVLIMMDWVRWKGLHHGNYFDSHAHILPRRVTIFPGLSFQIWEVIMWTSGHNFDRRITPTQSKRLIFAFFLWKLARAQTYTNTDHVLSKNSQGKHLFQPVSVLIQYWWCTHRV